MNAPLHQSAVITAPLGVGAMTLYECSNRSAQQPMPRVTLMRPVQIDEQTSNGAPYAIHHPAESFVLSDLEARELYEFMHAYYARSGRQMG